MHRSAILRLEAAAAAGQNQQLSQDPAFVYLSAGSTKCLALAAAGGHLSTVKLLLKHKAYTPAAGGLATRTDAAWRDLVSALVEAARHGHLEMAAALLRVRTKPDMCIAGYKTDGAALDAAAAGGHRAVVQLLCSTIPQQDVLGMSMRPVLKIFLAWDSRHAAQQGWSSFAWYSRIRPQFAYSVGVVLAITASTWALCAMECLPFPLEVWNQPLPFAFWGLLSIVCSVM